MVSSIPPPLEADQSLPLLFTAAYTAALNRQLEAFTMALEGSSDAPHASAATGSSTSITTPMLTPRGAAGFSPRGLPPPSAEASKRIQFLLTHRRRPAVSAAFSSSPEEASWWTLGHVSAHKKFTGAIRLLLAKAAWVGSVPLLISSSSASPTSPADNNGPSNGPSSNHQGNVPLLAQMLLTVDDIGQSILHVAAASGNVPITTMLLDEAAAISSAAVPPSALSAMLSMNRNGGGGDRNTNAAAMKGGGSSSNHNGVLVQSPNSAFSSASSTPRGAGGGGHGHDHGVVNDAGNSGTSQQHSTFFYQLLSLRDVQGRSAADVAAGASKALLRQLLTPKVAQQQQQQRSPSPPQPPNHPPQHPPITLLKASSNIPSAEIAVVQHQRQEIADSNGNSAGHYAALHAHPNEGAQQLASPSTLDVVNIGTPRATAAPAPAGQGGSAFPHAPSSLGPAKSSGESTAQLYPVVLPIRHSTSTLRPPEAANGLPPSTSLSQSAELGQHNNTTALNTAALGGGAHVQPAVSTSVSASVADGTAFEEILRLQSQMMTLVQRLQVEASLGTSPPTAGGSDKLAAASSSTLPGRSASYAEGGGPNATMPTPMRMVQQSTSAQASLSLVDLAVSEAELRGAIVCDFFEDRAVFAQHFSRVVLFTTIADMRPVLSPPSSAVPSSRPPRGGGDAVGKHANTASDVAPTAASPPPARPPAVVAVMVDATTEPDDELERSVLFVHGEKHVAGVELHLLVQWRGEANKGLEEWCPVEEVQHYAVVQAYLDHQQEMIEAEMEEMDYYEEGGGAATATENSSSTAGAAGGEYYYDEVYGGGNVIVGSGSPTPPDSQQQQQRSHLSAGHGAGRGREISPLGQTERDQLAQQLAALRAAAGSRTSRGGQTPVNGFNNNRGGGGGLINRVFSSRSQFRGGGATPLSQGGGGSDLQSSPSFFRGGVSGAMSLSSPIYYQQQQPQSRDFDESDSSSVVGIGLPPRRGPPSPSSNANFNRIMRRMVWSQPASGQNQNQRQQLPNGAARTGMGIPAPPTASSFENSRAGAAGTFNTVTTASSTEFLTDRSSVIVAAALLPEEVSRGDIAAVPHPPPPLPHPAASDHNTSSGDGPSTTTTTMRSTQNPPLNRQTQQPAVSTPPTSEAGPHNTGEGNGTANNHHNVAHTLFPEEMGPPSTNAMGSGGEIAAVAAVVSPPPSRLMQLADPPPEAVIGGDCGDRDGGVVEMPPSRGMLGPEFQSASIAECEDVLPRPPQRGMTPGQLLRWLERNRMMTEDSDGNKVLGLSRVDSDLLGGATAAVAAVDRGAAGGVEEEELGKSAILSYDDELDDEDDNNSVQPTPHRRHSSDLLPQRQQQQQAPPPPLSTEQLIPSVISSRSPSRSGGGANHSSSLKRPRSPSAATSPHNNHQRQQSPTQQQQPPSALRRTPSPHGNTMATSSSAGAAGDDQHRHPLPPPSRSRVGFAEPPVSSVTLVKGSVGGERSPSTDTTATLTPPPPQSTVPPTSGGVAARVDSTLMRPTITNGSATVATTKPPDTPATALSAAYDERMKRLGERHLLIQRAREEMERKIAAGKQQTQVQHQSPAKASVDPRPQSKKTEEDGPAASALSQSPSTPSSYSPSPTRGGPPQTTSPASVPLNGSKANSANPTSNGQSSTTPPAATASASTSQAMDDFMRHLRAEMSDAAGQLKEWEAVAAGIEASHPRGNSHSSHSPRSNPPSKRSSLDAYPRQHQTVAGAVHRSPLDGVDEAERTPRGHSNSTATLPPPPLPVAAPHGKNSDGGRRDRQSSFPSSVSDGGANSYQPQREQFSVGDLKSSLDSKHATDAQRGGSAEGVGASSMNALLRGIAVASGDPNRAGGSAGSVGVPPSSTASSTLSPSAAVRGTVNGAGNGSGDSPLVAGKGVATAAPTVSAAHVYTNINPSYGMGRRESSQQQQQHSEQLHGSGGGGLPPISPRRVSAPSTAASTANPSTGSPAGSTTVTPRAEAMGMAGPAFTTNRQQRMRVAGDEGAQPSPSASSLPPIGGGAAAAVPRYDRVNPSHSHQPEQQQQQQQPPYRSKSPTTTVEEVREDNGIGGSSGTAPRNNLYPQKRSPRQAAVDATPNMKKPSARNVGVSFSIDDGANGEGSSSRLPNISGGRPNAGGRPLSRPTHMAPLD